VAKRKRGRPPNAAATAEMARLRDAGLTLAEIGKRLGLSRQAVHIALARSGYQLPERPRQPPAPAESDGPANEPAKAPQPGPQAEVREVTVAPAPRKPRGLAVMTPERQRAIASLGGKAAHAKGTAHTFTRASAATAGRKGGRAAHAKGAAHEFGGEEAQQAASKGGRARWQHRPGGHLAMPKPRASTRRPGERRGRQADVARRAEVVRLRAEGLTLAEIGRRLGVSRQAVQLMLARARGAEGRPGEK